MRLPAISTLPVQKAGYAGQVLPEIRREGMVHVGERRELIVRPCSNRAAVVTGPARLLNALGRYQYQQTGKSWMSAVKYGSIPGCSKKRLFLLCRNRHEPIRFTPGP